MGPLARGDVVDGFRLDEVLHDGSMASIWSVSHPDHDAPLVMKIPGLYRGEDPAAIVSFEMEQMILPRLSGPHVPRFVAAGDLAEQPYLVMRRVPGATLRPRVREAPLPPAEVAAMGARIAQALASLHRQNVLHLDVKPSNVVLPSDDPDEGAVLLDFGLSHHVQLPDLIAEEFRLPFGTAPYMAPEQVLGVRSEPRSDLYALGVLMYRFVTGKLPFGDPQHMGGVRQRLWRDPMPPRRLSPDCPPWLQEIILRCLEVNPERRHPTAAQLALDLRNPGLVVLGARAARMRRDSLFAVTRRWLRASPPVRQGRALGTQIASSPIIAVAVDLTQPAPDLDEALRAAVANVLRTVPGARVAVIHVLRQGGLLGGGETALDAEGRNRHLRDLARLRLWAAPLKLAAERATFHVLEAPSPGEALVDYAGANHVDHVVMGARGSVGRWGVLGSVSGEVAAQAPCTVTVVRVQGRRG